MWEQLEVSPVNPRAGREGQNGKSGILQSHLAQLFPIYIQSGVVILAFSGDTVVISLSASPTFWMRFMAVLVKCCHIAMHA